uniref:Nuclease of the RNAse H fold, HicB family n=1 Tax=Candidatus Kentrum sp. FW TaxID=2126338 RepID=A0A450SHC2_9GAMM|nr:MAG: hypothetical protein BECKFW1821B_GA0114236_101237 [Candidatus Kentron sp. FW]
MRSKQLTAIIEKEGDGYVALCPEVDVASQGDTVVQARENLKEALELFFEMASPEELDSRLHDEVYITHLEIAPQKTIHRQTKGFLGQESLSTA